MRLLTRAKKPAGRAAKPGRAAAPKRKAARKTRRFDPVAFRRGVKLGAMGLCGLTVAGGLFYAWQTDLVGRTGSWVYETAMEATAELGLAVREVYVVGRRETDRQDLLDAIGLSIGDAILDADPDEIRERVVGLGWVRAAEVRRILPGTMVIDIQERNAVAIWQHEDRFVLIDPDGERIGEHDVHRHRHLKVVVGPDAPDHTQDLLEMLAGEPELEDRVVAAVRVGRRRWNLRLDGGVDVRLPEEGALAAWRLLADYQRDHEILSRAVGAIDLRYPDRISVQLTEPGLQEIRGRTAEDEET